MASSWGDAVRGPVVGRSSTDRCRRCQQGRQAHHAEDGPMRSAARALPVELSRDVSEMPSCSALTPTPPVPTTQPPDARCCYRRQETTDVAVRAPSAL